MAPARARSAPLPSWLRLEAKVATEQGLVLEFVASDRGGPGINPHQLGELLAAGDRVRVAIRLDGTAEVQVELQQARRGADTQDSTGGLGTPAAEDQGSPFPVSPPPPADGDLSPILPIDAPGPEPEERQVAVTQEVTPLGDLVPVEPDPVPTCACGCGGELVRNARGGLARFLLGHGTRLRTREQRLQAGAKAGAANHRREYHEASVPARLAELRARIAAGTYDAGAELRELVEARGLAAMVGQRR